MGGPRDRGQPPLAPFRGEPIGLSATPSDAKLEERARRTSQTIEHGSGTCAIGAVVSPELRVSGIEALRLVDASVVPSIPPLTSTPPC